MRVLVVTVVHRPDDARILQREIAALRSAGHEVTYAAPFSGCGVDRPAGIRTIDLPRAHGRHRLTAFRIARRMLRLQAPQHDAVILHDPELLAAAAGLKHPVIVWDVHEDTAAAVTLKSWLPHWARGSAARLIRGVESAAERRRLLVLAEAAYAERFREVHPVVPNTTSVAAAVEPSQRGRAVYVGHLTRARGALDLIEVGRLLRAAGMRLDVVGHADSHVRPSLEEAHAAEWITWHGFLPNDEALRLLDGATAGLSLLHDEDNYRVSMPTKVIEYMAHGVPVVSTPLPLAAALVREHSCGVIVPFADPAAAAAAVIELDADDEARRAMGAHGHAAAVENWNWDRDGAAFVQVLEEWVSQSQLL